MKRAGGAAFAWGVLATCGCAGAGAYRAPDGGVDATTSTSEGGTGETLGLNDVSILLPLSLIHI